MLGMPKKWRDIKRFQQVVKVLLKHEMSFILERLRIKKISFRTGHKIISPKQLRLIIEDLGGSFIKLGQLQLQDHVRPFSYEEAKKIIESLLRKPIKKIFKNFEKKPLAAASIGQVHRATLKNNQKVAVKIQRPKIKELFDTDIEIMLYFAELFQKHYPQTFFDPIQIVREFKEYTEREINYLWEAKSLKEFHHNFKGTKTRIPKIYSELTTAKVLTMEYISGEKISDLLRKNKKFNREKVSHKIAYAVLKQIFIDGLFHADPHPGNIMLLKNNEVALLDFGITGKLDKETKEYLSILFISLINKDLDGIASSMARLHFTGKSTDYEQLKKDLRNILGPYYDMPLKSIDLPELFIKSINTAKKNNIMIPKNYVLLGKCLITLESLCQRINPNFNMIEVSKPFIKKLLEKDMDPKEVIKKAYKESIRIKEFITEVPEMVREYFEREEEKEEDIKRLSEEIKEMTHEMDVISERFIIAIVMIIIMLASIYLIKIGPGLFGISTFSLAGFLIVLALLIMLVYSLIKD
jgi:ubiquinone biosynthesis protein